MSVCCECCLLSGKEVSATGRSLVQSSPTHRSVSSCVIYSLKNETAFDREMLSHALELCIYLLLQVLVLGNSGRTCFGHSV
jgi:hypothetical protein